MDFNSIIIKLKGTKKVYDLSYMFSDCKNLLSLELLSGFETSNVINMSNMFNNCIALKEISNNFFNTQNVTNMSRMFANCQSLYNCSSISE